MNTPPRGFPESEFAHRTEHMQRAMRRDRLDALLLTTEPNVRYFSGFFTQFWESPTRPWFLVVPASGKPIAVIPAIGAHGMASTWVEDIRSWPSPRPQDDGISLLADCLGSLAQRFRRIGMTLGAESVVRMPLLNLEALRERLGGVEWVDAGALMRDQRMVKSALEIAKIRHICQLTSDSFDALPQFAAAGHSEAEICRQMRIDLLRRGVDNTPYMISGSGPGGYHEIIMGPAERTLEEGDVFMIDTGSTWDGYFCDFDRNFTCGTPAAATRDAHETLWHATEAGFNAARPGATTVDLWQAMATAITAGGGQATGTGRLGHGLGMQLTEPPSHLPDHPVELACGMVLTLEPSMTFGDGVQLVHEENIVVTEDGAEWLSRRAPLALPQL